MAFPGSRERMRGAKLQESRLEMGRMQEYETKDRE